jgi:hypothetical protein
MPFCRLYAPFFLVLSANLAFAQDFSSDPSTKPFIEPSLGELSQEPSYPTPGTVPDGLPLLRASQPRARTRALPLPPLPPLLPPPDSFGQKPSEIYPWLESVARARSRSVRNQTARLRIIGNSSSGASIVAIEVTPRGVPAAKLRRLAIVCRQHGNEPEATASGTRFLYQFLNSNNPLQRRIAQRTALLIVPIANPDGAEIYERRTARNIDMNRDWGRNQSPEVRALIGTLRAWKPNLVIDNHQWLPLDGQPKPMAEASGGASARRTALLMSQRSAQRGYALAARSRWGLDTLCHRYWGQRFKIPAILLETRHRPAVAGARQVAIQQALAGLWGAAESLKTSAR